MQSGVGFSLGTVGDKEDGCPETAMGCASHVRAATPTVAAADRAVLGQPGDVARCGYGRVGLALLGFVPLEHKMKYGEGGRIGCPLVRRQKAITLVRRNKHNEED